MFIKEKGIHSIFVISIILKGVNALMEIAGSIIIFIISQDLVTKLVLRLTQEELSEDPQDLIANYLVNSASHFSVNAQHFFAFYLFSHGIIKLALVVGLLKNKFWAYPASLVVFGIFIIYQIYRYYFTHSVWLVALTVFDLLVIWLVWHEYNYLKRQRKV